MLLGEWWAIRGICVGYGRGIKRKILGKKLPRARGLLGSRVEAQRLSGGLLCGLYGRSTERKESRQLVGLSAGEKGCSSVVDPTETQKHENS